MIPLHVSVHSFLGRRRMTMQWWSYFHTTSFDFVVNTEAKYDIWLYTYIIVCGKFFLKNKIKQNASVDIRGNNLLLKRGGSGAGCALSVLCMVTNWSVCISHGTKLSLSVISWRQSPAYTGAVSVLIRFINLFWYFHQNIYLLAEIIDTMSLEKWKVGKVSVCCLFLET